MRSIVLLSAISTVSPYHTVGTKQAVLSVSCHARSEVKIGQIEHQVMSLLVYPTEEYLDASLPHAMPLCHEDVVTMPLPKFIPGCLSVAGSFLQRVSHVLTC